MLTCAADVTTKGDWRTFAMVFRRKSTLWLLHHHEKASENARDRYLTFSKSMYLPRPSGNAHFACAVKQLTDIR